MQGIILLIHQLNVLRCFIHGPYSGIDLDELELMAAIFYQHLSFGMCDTYHHIASGYTQVECCQR